MSQVQSEGVFIASESPMFPDKTFLEYLEFPQVKYPNLLNG